LAHYFVVVDVVAAPRRGGGQVDNTRSTVQASANWIKTMPQWLPYRYVTTKIQQVRSTMQCGWLKLWTCSCRDPALT